METNSTFANAAPLLDVARGVGMMGSESGLRKILKTVVLSMTADLPKIESALQAGDVPTANRLLHAIKGYMPIFACDPLVELVTAVEKLSKTAPIEQVQSPYQQLGPQLHALVAEIEIFLTTD
jgi:HPt (histidine-containing phosphotransfer) domain-containing protein